MPVFAHPARRELCIDTDDMLVRYGTRLFNAAGRLHSEHGGLVPVSRREFRAMDFSTITNAELIERDQILLIENNKGDYVFMLHVPH